MSPSDGGKKRRVRGDEQKTAGKTVPVKKKNRAVGKKSEAERSEKQLLWSWVAAALFLIAAVAFLAVSCSRTTATSDSGVPLSVKKRTPLAEGSVVESGYYTDDLNWLGQGNSTVLRSMRYFYKRTGVQPYLYLTNNLGLTGTVPSEEAIRAAAADMYRTLFKDEGHLLLFVYRNDLYSSDMLSCCEVGPAASRVMDEEAVSILLAYLETAYSDPDRTEGREDRMFAQVFRNTANNIMPEKDRTGWIVLLVILLAVFLLIIAVDFSRTRRTMREEEEQEFKALNEEIFERSKKNSSA